MNKNFKVDPYFINGQHRVTITVVGAGGTGSLLVTKLARFSQALNHLDHPGLYVHCVDFDKIEKHNVGRQLFTPYDIGYYKSDVLISKINHAFGFDWSRSTHAFDKKEANTNILISCVDNIVARKYMLEAFYFEQEKYVGDTKKKYLFLDCGNARDFGQVILSDYGKKLKNVIDIFGSDINTQDTKEIQGPGCSYQDRLNEQDLFINDWVSLYAITIIKDLLFKKEIDYQGFFFNTSDYLTKKIML